MPACSTAPHPPQHSVPLATLHLGEHNYRIVDLPAAAGADYARLPWVLRLLLENVLRTSADAPSAAAARSARAAILAWLEHGSSTAEIEFSPGRVLMHDTTCGPALADIAAMRSVLAEAGVDPLRLNPVLPVDVSTDHSLPVDFYAEPEAMARNMDAELRRNAERYRFMKWAATTLRGVRVHPPGTGIMHTLNLERLASVVDVELRDGAEWLRPDTLLGTDSHTPMINGLGVLAWGVGGLEAESVMFGVPVMLRLPDVVGVRLSGALPPGVLATDLALTVTERLRRLDLADKFVEFCGPGVATLDVGARACVANMAPEYGASSGYFPIDAATLDYLRQTGRDAEHVARVEAYARRQGLWFDPEATATPRYTTLVEIDLADIRPTLAGPRRPQDRIAIGDAAAALCAASGRAALRPGDGRTPPDGAVAIAAITSCTNTSDLRLLVAAGLLARKARTLGLKPPAWVKTSLAPGSPTARGALERCGLLADLETVGFGIVGYGCTTCIGNSGALPAPIVAAMRGEGGPGIVPVVVLSGNRNFPGRVHPELDAGFLASPPLVIAYALAGDVNRDLTRDPVAHTPDGTPVHLAELWPTAPEIEAALAQARAPEAYAPDYTAAEASPAWQALVAPESAVFPWDAASTYIRRPPFVQRAQPTRLGRYAARVLLALGDDVTTDHISPVGQIPANSEAGRHLVAAGDDPGDLNVYAARRANWEVMLRGAFTNKSVRNLLAPEAPPGSTVHAPSGEVLPLPEAARRYTAEGESLVIVAGERYGMGSSRDWAAKAVALLEVRAVLAVGFERIHRANLVGMGVLPICLPAGTTPQTLALHVEDRIEIDAPAEALAPRQAIGIRILRRDGRCETLLGRAAVETSREVAQLRSGGLIPYILQRVGDD